MMLLVEDEEDDVFLMERALMKIKPARPMQRVKNGQEALDYLQGTGNYSDRSLHPLPQLVFLDLKLPFVHGFDVLKWIKNEPNLDKIHVAILTSSLEDLDLQRAIHIGANSFSIKPPKSEKIREIIESVFGP